MKNTTRSIYSSDLQTCLNLGLAYVIASHTTLNEKFSIQNGVLPPAAETPTVAYFAIGNGGHTLTVGASGIPKPEPIQHLGTDAALYNHFPFVLRAIANDLSTAEQANYALRRIETWNGAPYVAYYLKRISLAGVGASMNLVSVANGVSTVSAFVPTSANLNPTPPVLSPTGVNVTSGNYVSASAQLSLTMTVAEVAELLAASTIIYNDPDFAIISEIALCSGVDKVVPSPGIGNTTINFNEAIGVQCMAYINTFIPAAYTNNGINTLLDVGATEPLFSTAQ